MKHSVINKHLIPMNTFHWVLYKNYRILLSSSFINSCYLSNVYFMLRVFFCFSQYLKKKISTICKFSMNIQNNLTNIIDRIKYVECGHNLQKFEVIKTKLKLGLKKFKSHAHLIVNYYQQDKKYIIENWIILGNFKPDTQKYF